MRVRVIFFGVLKELARKSADYVQVREGARVSEVIEHYKSHAPGIAPLLSSTAVAVNQQYVGVETTLKADDEVAFLPPVSGGSGEKNLVRLVRERIVPHDIVLPMERPEDGAIVVFDGIVRNHSRNRKTLYLEYEAYEAMALIKLQELVAEAMQRFTIRNVALVHRLGHLDIGESSILIAVFSAHRAPAFEACRWLIDTLKRTVPIWKKEYFEDGAVWADGEPFPHEIPKAQ
jgi:molybdopterin synthase catalytic subunit/molybdopterin converting factor small subunit